MSNAPSNPLVLDISGMHCAGCAGAVERALHKVVGESAAKVHLALNRADISLPAGVREADVVAAVQAAGYGAVPRQGSARERRLAKERMDADRRAEDRRTFLLFVVSALLTLPFMVDMAQATISGHPHVIPPLVQLVLATIVQFVCGWRFLAGAIRAIRAMAPNMDVLVSVGTLAAYGLSTWQVLTGAAHHGAPLYFEGAAAIITFVLLGKVLESRARAGAAEALEALAREQPSRAMVAVDGQWLERPVEQIVPGDRVLVRAGERAAVDGVVIEGTGDMDEALITGESLPVAKRVGQKVIAGALNGNAALAIEASAVGEDTTLARLARLVDQAQTARAPLQKLVDVVSRWFVPGVLLIALATAGAWWWSGATTDATISAAVSVLAIACPCALGLAAPIALVAGTGIAARNGIVIRDLAALEAAATVETVAFDKTGTITEGQPQVVAISAPGVGSEDALKIAAALAAVSDHPLAKAVIAAAQDRGIAGAPATDVVAIPGEGLVGRVNGVEALFGSADFLRQRGIVLGVIEQVITNDQSFGEAQSISWLAGANRVIGAIAFSDAVRPHVREALADLSSMGVSTLLLSGDRPATTAAIARDIGISEAKGGLKPEAKVAALRAMTSAGRRLAMVGDGINDAPALAAAHVGMAMGTGSEAARAAAGITLMRPDLSLVPKTLRVARRTRATIRQNLFLAFVFNVVSIPLAAFGQLTPAIAGAAMAASSVLVVLNAWRLARIRV